MDRVRVKELLKRRDEMEYDLMHANIELETIRDIRSMDTDEIDKDYIDEYLECCLVNCMPALEHFNYLKDMNLYNSNIAYRADVLEEEYGDLMELDVTSIDVQEVYKYFIDEYRNLYIEGMIIVNGLSNSIKSTLELKETNLTNKVSELNASKSKVVDELKIYENEYLMTLVNKANEELRKKAFPYKRHKFISDYFLDKTTFKFEEKMDYYTGGHFRQGDKHLNGMTIAINSKYLDNNTLNPSMRTTFNQKYNKNQVIINILKHELLHMYQYVNHFYEDRPSLYTSDNSPLFICKLLYLNPEERNSYESFKDVKQTDLYKKIMNMKTFKEVEDYLFFTSLKLEKFINKNKDYIVKFNDASKKSSNEIKILEENVTEKYISHLKEIENDVTIIDLVNKQYPNETEEFKANKIEEYKTNVKKSMAECKENGITQLYVTIPYDLEHLDNYNSQLINLIQGKLE